MRQYSEGEEKKAKDIPWGIPRLLFLEGNKQKPCNKVRYLKKVKLCGVSEMPWSFSGLAGRSVDDCLWEEDPSVHAEECVGDRRAEEEPAASCRHEVSFLRQETLTLVYTQGSSGKNGTD